MPGHSYGYLVDLRGVSLNEAQATWLQAFPFGKYEHPIYGTISMDASKATTMATQVKSNIRGQDLDIDYDHKERDGVAAGWVKDAEVRPDGLYLSVQFTPKAVEHIKNYEYRYFSPEYADEWEDPRDATKYKDVLMGGALTNRPFLKGILPINLSEAFSCSNTPPKGENKVDPKLLRTYLGLAETATDEEVTAKLNEGPPKPEKVKDDPKPDDEALKKLAESNPTIRVMLERQATQDALLAEQSKQLGILSAANRLSEINTKLAELNTDKVVIAPAAEEKLRAAIIEAPKALGDKMIDALKELLADGMVELGERGGKAPSNNSQDGATKFLTAVNELVKTSEGKMTFEEAAGLISANDPQLFDAYREASYAWKEG